LRQSITRSPRNDSKSGSLNEQPSREQITLLARDETAANLTTNRKRQNKMRKQQIFTIMAVALLASSAIMAAPGIDSHWIRETAISYRWPEYPLEARSRHITGTGVFLLFVNPKTGLVTKVHTHKSTGSPILDKAAIKAFWFWGFQTPLRYPNQPVTVPVIFN
jgi:TonB family protein